MTNTAEMSRQVADDQAKATFLAGDTQTAYDAALQANTITYYRAVISSAIANGLQYAVFSEHFTDRPAAIPDHRQDIGAFLSEVRV
jgi:hypothetical protein